MKVHEISKYLRTRLTGLMHGLLDRVPLRVEIRRPRPTYPGVEDRFTYQSLHADFSVQPGDKILDIGSGGYPFPYATVLVDQFLEPSRHRHEPLVQGDKPLVLADIHYLPFNTKSFDFVYCSHILEHTDNPVRACSEIMRVGKRGYVETPTIGKDALFAWAKDMHKWYVVAAGKNLCFFEYSNRQLEGIRSPVWRDIILGRWYHPLQEAFYMNQDMFNVMLSWTDHFHVFVFRKDGSVETLNGEVYSTSAIPHSQH